MPFDSDKQSLSIFLPVYNEEKVIDITISQLLKVVSGLVDDYEILLINDGSTDMSQEKILKWAQSNDKIRFINHKANMGYGRALRSGFENARKNLILYTDADMPVLPDAIGNVLPFMNSYDMVIGYRINRDDTPRRFVYSKAYNFLLRVFFGVKVRDANFSFKCIRRESFAKCCLRAKGVFIDGELLSEAARNNFTIKEIPIVYQPRKYGKSNFDSFRTAFFTFYEMFHYWRANRLFKRGKRIEKKSDC